MTGFTAEQLAHLADRHEWCEVTTRQNAHGTWDVALVIDGHYSIEADAEDTADFFARELGVPRAERRPA